MTKKLYIVIRDCGDGSETLDYTFDEDKINELYRQEEAGELDESYWSGDGLQVHELNVPEECTYKSLGIYEFEFIN